MICHPGPVPGLAGSRDASSTAPAATPAKRSLQNQGLELSCDSLF